MDVTIKMGKTKEVGIEKLLTKARQDTEVLAVLIFGSAARHEQTPLSDVDICLVMMPRVIPVKPVALIDKRLEYMKDSSLDVQIFHQLPLYVRKRVLKEGQVLFTRDERLLYELAFHTAQAFEDFRHIYSEYLREVESAGS